MRDEEGRKVETAVEARAGFLDRPVLVVLCVSLALGVIVLGACGSAFSRPALELARCPAQCPGNTMTLGVVGKLVFDTTSEGTSLVSTVQFCRARARKRSRL
jgi:hypothetical protein